MRTYPHRGFSRASRTTSSLTRGSRGRPPGLASRVGPTPSDQAAVPAQEGLRPDEERRPSPTRQQTGGGGQEDPIGVGHLDSRNLTAQDSELVAEDDDLDLLGALGAEPERRQGQHAFGQDVEEREQHLRSLRLD